MNNWTGKVVVVTGGSDGLGKAIALAFASEGAKSILIARDSGRLREVVDGTELDLDSVVCDVTDDLSVQSAVRLIMERHGRIDVWVNNVGQSTRIKFEECGVEEYRKLIEINFFSAVRCTLAVLDHLAETSGQVVNIGSLAAKTAWPNVAPYSVSKHALAAFSHQLRIEGPENVGCLFVCPGPIQRSDASRRYDDQATGMGDAARQPGAGVKLKGIPPQRLAKKIVRYCASRKKELVLPGYSRILFALAQLSPTLGDFLLRRSSGKKTRKKTRK